MTNIPARLRAQCDYYGHAYPPDAREAAHRIEALEAALRELLSLADITQPYPEHLASGIVSRARAALEPATSETKVDDPLCRDGKPHDFILARFGRTETCHKCGEQK